MRHPLRLNWEKVEGKVVAQNLVRRVDRNTEQYGHVVIKTFDYMVEIADLDGQPKRLIIREESAKLRLPDNGNPVPLLVNAKRTKAAFDLDGTAIDAVGRSKLADKRRKEQQKARAEKFKRKLDQNG